MTAEPLTQADRAAIEDVWQCVLATGRLPAAAGTVRDRLVRQVARIELPSGGAFAKGMSFPRKKDKLRYALRSLPAVREASMLAAVRAAGLPCPEVLAVRTERRGLLPFRSLLVLRALDVGDEEGDASVRLGSRAMVAVRLADCGLLHPDLNPDNFLPLRDGRLAVLDVQSMQRTRAAASAKRAMAARLLCECTELQPLVARDVLVKAGLVPAADDEVLRAAREIAADWLCTRARRCLQSSTEFSRRRNGLFAVEHCRRSLPAQTRWLDRDERALHVWLGQRVLEVVERSQPVFLGLEHSGLPFSRSGSLLVAEDVSGEAITTARARCLQALQQHRWLHGGGERPQLVELQRLRDLQRQPLR